MSLPGPGEPRPPLPPGSLRCPRCSSALGPEQDWCLECGAPARTRLAATPDWRVPFAGVAAIVALAGALLAFAFVRLTDDGGVAAGTTPTAPVQTAPPALPGATAPVTTAPQPGPATTLPSATTTLPAATVPPATAVPGQAVPPAAATATQPRARTATVPRRGGAGAAAGTASGDPQTE